MNLRDRIRGLFSKPGAEQLFAVPRPDGLLIVPAPLAPDDEHWPISSPLALAALDELSSSDLASEREDGFFIGWDSLYRLLADQDRRESVSVLQIPPIGSLRPRLRSSNTLDDPDF